jgi:BirA family biotin operon repressor/biotin-[acetyl-CoA-carboxylase] ligase
MKEAIERVSATDAGLLSALRAAGGEYVSGQSLSVGLDVSRTAVWKRIKNLKDLGYAVDAAPRKGYRLAPGADGRGERFNGLEVLSSLETSFVGKSLYFHDELPSTNDAAAVLARSGAAEGTAVIADRQTAGKGRLGRKWHSPAGKNLYTSVILRPAVAPSEAQSLTLALAVAAAEALEGFSTTRPAVKWPNDVLMGGRKVAGILTEMASDMDRVGHVVAGLGVNVNAENSSFPAELRTKAASLREFSKTGAVSRARLAAALYSSIEKWYKIFLDEGLKAVVTAWRGYFEAEGRTIRVNVMDGTVSGVCMGIDRDGALLVREPTGNVARITSGEMEVLGRSGH